MARTYTTRDPAPRHRLAPPSGARLWLALLLASAGGAEEMRVWTSSDGKTVTAELVSATDTTVTIKNGAGREFTFPHERLSQADRDIIQAHLAKKKAEYDSIIWPKANAEDAIAAPLLKKLHALDSKKFNATYAGRVLAIQGTVLDVREDRVSANQGIIVVLDTEDKMPVELKFNKTNYDKDLTLLGGTYYNHYRNPYGEESFRVSVVDKSMVVERRYVTSRDSYYNDSVGEYRYRKKWSEWEVIAKPAARGESVIICGEFVSVFNSVMSLKDARLVNESAYPRRTIQ